MGISLKERRVQLGMELDQVADATRVKVSYLKAIEEEDFAKLPMEVYSKGYIREYARFLGVSPESVLVRYEIYLDEQKAIKEKIQQKDSIKDKVVKPAVSADTAKAVTPQFGVPDSLSAWKGILSQKTFWIILVIILMAGAAIGYFLLPHGKEAEVSTKETVPVVPVPPPTETTDKAVTLDTPAVQAVPPAGPAEKARPADADIKAKVRSDDATGRKHNLEIAATDKVWLQVIIDGSEKKEAMLNEGDRINYTAGESFELIVGNAAGAKLRYNGKDFDNLGEKGQVIRFNVPGMSSPQMINVKKKEQPLPAAPASP